MRNNKIEEAIAYFKSPTNLCKPQQIIDNPKLIPRERGIYGWYFDVLIPGVNENDYIQVAGYRLLYVGIAGRYEHKRGDLRRRLRSNHLGKHSTGSSTLRRTLGKLLTDELRLVKKKKNDRYWFGEDGEKKLRDWMCDHAKIAFQLDPNPREIEETIIARFGNILPLNKEGNIFKSL